MKLIIDIDDEVYDWFNTGFPDEEDAEKLWQIVKNGTPLPDNATNGDVIKALFPTADISLNDSCFEGVVNKYGFDMKWWSSPYQKGGTTRKNCEYRHENGNCLKVGGFCTSVDDEHCVKGGKE